MKRKELDLAIKKFEKSLSETYPYPILMKLFKKLKPKFKKIDLNRLRPEEIDYFCKTSVIDRIRCERKKIKFNKTIASMMEEKVRFYFIVKKNMEYYILSGIEFEPWLKEHSLAEKEQSKKALSCINNYIKDLD